MKHAGQNAREHGDVNKLLVFVAWCSFVYILEYRANEKIVGRNKQKELWEWTNWGKKLSQWIPFMC